jgi:hypothetical protein
MSPSSIVCKLRRKYASKNLLLRQSAHSFMHRPQASRIKEVLCDLSSVVCASSYCSQAAQCLNRADAPSLPASRPQIRWQTQLSKPPSTSNVRPININQVNAETQELRRLADGLPLQIDQVTKGQMPKDLAGNLKRIQQLAKHLGSEITPQIAGSLAACCLVICSRDNP